MGYGGMHSYPITDATTISTIIHSRHDFTHVLQIDNDACLVLLR